MKQILSQAFLALAGLVLSRAALALAHAHGWYPENQVKEFVMSLKTRIRKVTRRLAAKFQRPPEIKDAPGLFWRRRKDGWAAIWQARPAYVKRGFIPRRHTIAVVTKNMSPDEKDFISECCVRLQNEMLRYTKPTDKDLPSMEEILASIRRIISDESPPASVSSV